jgi:CheY-like chemotaxis protein
LSQNALPTIFIINTSDDYLDIMRRLLNSEGYIAIPFSITDIKSGMVDIAERMREQDPKVIVYDIAFPYIENWRQFQNILSLESSKNREFIITTPNINALEQQVGKSVTAYQIIDKEVDLQKLVTHVHSVWEKQIKAD